MTTSEIIQSPRTVRWGVLVIAVVSAIVVTSVTVGLYFQYQTAQYFRTVDCEASLSIAALKQANTAPPTTDSGRGINSKLDRIANAFEVKAAKLGCPPDKTPPTP